MVQHITISRKEAPELLKKVYRVLNRPAVCFYCGKPAQYIQIAVENEKHLLTRNICHTCETARRKKRWLKKQT